MNPCISPSPSMQFSVFPEGRKWDIHGCVCAHVCACIHTHTHTRFLPEPPPPHSHVGTWRRWWLWQIDSCLGKKSQEALGKEVWANLPTNLVASVKGKPSLFLQYSFPMSFSKLSFLYSTTQRRKLHGYKEFTYVTNIVYGDIGHPQVNYLPH